MTDTWALKKKVLTRKERFRITEDSVRKKEKEDGIEKLLLQKEEQAQKLRLEDKVKKERADMEHEIRCFRLTSNCEKFGRLRETIIQQRLQSRDAKTLNEYPEIKNLKRIVPWVNERISKCRGEKRNTHLKNEIHACIRMLNMLTAYIENPLNIGRVQNWYECRREIRTHLYETLDCSSYDVVKDIEKKMFYANADTVYYKERDEYFSHAIWTVLEKQRTGKDDKFPLVCNFEECGVMVNLPKAFLNQQFAVRCLIMLEDYFSADCRTSRQTLLPSNLSGDFYEYHKQLRIRQEELRKQQEEEEVRMEEERQRRLSILNKIKHLIPAMSNGGEGADAKPSSDDANATADAASTETQPKDLEYLSKFINLKKSYSKLMLDDEKNETQRVKRDLMMPVDAYECNMRKFSIVGGVYHLDIVKQPPQPKILKDGAILRTIIGKDALQRWPYHETYEPPTIKTGPTKQSTDDDDDDDAENTPEGTLLSKIILVVIKLPDHVLWFDTPTPVLWDFDENYWSTDHVYDTKFNEEKQTISFRAGKMGPFGLAVFRYNNFPFQSWELKSREASSNEVVFSLTTSNLMLEFLIRRHEICLAVLENANTSALQQLVGEFYEPEVLMRLLKTGGVNVFPDEDACVYVDGAQVKHRPTEDYLYFCMASLCLRYHFSWSRWNLMAGYKRFVVQAQKCAASSGNNLLLVTDQRAVMADGTDVQSLGEIESEERTFYPDLLTLVLNSEDEASRKVVEETDELFVGTVYFMLSRIRVLSFS